MKPQQEDRLPPNMTREQAVLKAREVFGEMGTISAFDAPGFPCMVWKIGELETTIGRGHTWESAFRNSAWRMERNAKKGRVK
jgi:hypothetical protein